MSGAVVLGEPTGVANAKISAGNDSTVLVEDLTGTGHMTEHELGDQRVLVIPVGLD